MVGSSNNKISGSQNKILAKAILILHPPDNLRLGLFYISVLNPNLSNKIEALAKDSLAPISYSQFWTIVNSSTFPDLINKSS